MKLYCLEFRQFRSLALQDMFLQDGREISAIIVTDDYLCYKERKSPYNFFLILKFNELFKFKTSDERQH